MDSEDFHRKTFEALESEFTRLERGEALEAAGMNRRYFSNVRTGRSSLTIKKLHTLLSHKGIKTGHWLYMAVKDDDEPPVEVRKQPEAIELEDLPDDHPLRLVNQE